MDLHRDVLRALNGFQGSCREHLEAHYNNESFHLSDGKSLVAKQELRHLHRIRGIWMKAETNSLLSQKSQDSIC